MGQAHEPTSVNRGPYPLAFLNFNIDKDLCRCSPLLAYVQIYNIWRPLSPSRNFPRIEIEIARTISITISISTYLEGITKSIDVGTEELYNLTFTPLHLSRVAETKVEMFHHHTRAQVQTRTS